MTSLGKPEKNKINKNVVKPNESDYELGTKLIERMYSEIRIMSTNKQIFIGATSGWVFGILAMKIGRTLALAAGGGLILLQIATDKGYISINWNQFDKNAKKEQNNTGIIDSQVLPISGPNWIKKIASFAAESMSLTVGILGGFFIGLAS